MSATRLPATDSAAREAGAVLEALLDIGQEASLPASGSSMRPKIVPGDRIVIAPFLGLPRPGQIVVARVGGNLVAHRLIEVEVGRPRRLYRLRGDAVRSGQEVVLREDLLGRVVAIVRQGRRAQVDDSPLACRRALLWLALRRRLARRGRAAAVLLLASLCALGVIAAGQEMTYAPAPEYRFGAGDVLRLRIWNGEKIDEFELTVQSDGAAFLPIVGIGSLPVGGKTSAEAKQDLERRLGAIYKQTNIELLVARYAGHRVHLMGEVRTTARTDSGPGEWPLTGTTRLVSFLSEHGGASPEADLMRIQLIRKAGERRELNLFRAVFLGSEEDDPSLQSGDLIFVPSLAMGNRKVYVLGEVNSPGVVNIVDHLGLVEAIARAGGFTQKGYLKGVVVVKRDGEGKAELRLANFKDMFRTASLEADIPLQPGDIVFVPRRALATLQEVFSIIQPALGIIESIYIIDNFRKGR